MTLIRSRLQSHLRLNVLLEKLGKLAPFVTADRSVLTLPNPIPTSAQQLSTPQWLKLGLYTVCGTTFFTVALGLIAMGQQQTALRLLAEDSAPSMLTTLRIQDSLAALDASLANELLLPPGQNQAARQEADVRQKKLANYWIQIISKLSYGNPELRPVTMLQLGLGDYLMAIERARVWHGQDNAAETAKAYAASLQQLDQQLLPAARALGQVKAEQLARAERLQQARIHTTRVGLILSGVGLLGYLVSVQWFLSQRTRRVLHPLLFSAMLGALGLWVHTLRSLDTAATQIAQAQSDTFAALVDLRTIRTLAYSAHADVSRALLDPVKTLQYDTSFRLKLNQIVSLSTIDAVSNASYSFEPIFSDLLGSVAQSLKTEEEQAMVETTVKALKTYSQHYETIHRFNQQGRKQEAIALATGYQIDQLNGSFELFRDAHQKLLEVQLAAFDQSIGSASKTLEALRWQLPVGGIIIMGLTAVGIQLRLREYQQ